MISLRATGSPPIALGDMQTATRNGSPAQERKSRILYQIHYTSMKAGFRIEKQSREVPYPLQDQTANSEGSSDRLTIECPLAKTQQPLDAFVHGRAQALLNELLQRQPMVANRSWARSKCAPIHSSSTRQSWVLVFGSQAMPTARGRTGPRSPSRPSAKRAA